MKENGKKFFKQYLIALIVSLLVGLGIFFLFWFALRKGPINASSIAGLILLAIGGLMFVTYEGFFDVFSYGIKQTFSSIFGKKANENNDFPGYKEQKNAKRESEAKIYICILISGCFFMLLFLVLKIIFQY